MSFAAALFFELYFKLDYLDARTAAVADIEGAHQPWGQRRRDRRSADSHWTAEPAIGENSLAPRRTGIDEGLQQALKSLMSVAAPAPLYRLE